jgi:hypothetical protein
MDPTAKMEISQFNKRIKTLSDLQKKLPIKGNLVSTETLVKESFVEKGL